MAVAGIAAFPGTTQAVSQGGRLRDEGKAEFASPWGLATDEFGDVYVSDTKTHKIYKFDSQTLRQEWVAGGYGSGNNQLYVPQGIAVADGVVYVADTLNHRIAMFTQDGGRWEGSIVGEGDNAFAYPADVDYFDGRLYIAEGGAHCRISVIQVSGDSFTLLGTIGGCGTGEQQLGSPTGVAVTDTEVFVADPHFGVVKKFNHRGLHLLTIGEPGTGRGQLDGPWAVAVSKTEARGTLVWVIEAGSQSRAQLFSGDDGTLKTVLPGHIRDHFTYPHGIALDPTGDKLWIADTSGEDPNVYWFLDTEPQLTVVGDDNLRHLGRTEGIWVRMSYNQTTKSCTVLARATVTVPGHQSFTVEEDFRVKNLADDFKIDVSAKRARWLRQAEEAGKRVPISATFRGNCSEDVRVRAAEDYKAS